MKPQARAHREPNLLPNYLILTLLLIFALGPLVLLVFNSLKSPAEIGGNPLGIPMRPVWENFANAWEIGNFSTTTRNSAILVAGTVVGVLITGGMTAYSLAKLENVIATPHLGYYTERALENQLRKVVESVVANVR